MLNSATFDPTDERSAGQYVFPDCPASWHYLSPVRTLERGPVSVELPRHSLFVGYRTSSGRIVVLDGRCSHADAQITKGTVSGENLICPVHGWEYDPKGECVRIPGETSIPGWARQCSYPVQDIAGHVFFFNRKKASFPFPGFDLDWQKLRAARPFVLQADAPWHVTSSNGFDVQHFRCSHDRELIGDPVVNELHPMARSITATFKVAGHSWRDALTRRFSGREVTMTVADWAGNLILVTAKFVRTTSYGLLAAQPLRGGRTLARVIVFVPRSRTRIGSLLFDPLDAHVRRSFIRAFIQSDVERAAGLRYDPRRLIEPDRVLREYLEWLEQIHRRKELK